MSAHDRERAWALLEAVKGQADFIAAEKALHDAWQARDNLIRTAHNRGNSKGALAHHLGMNPTKVGKILGTKTLP